MSLIGFTGTRQGMTPEQYYVVEDILKRYYFKHTENHFRHGDCVGADEQAAQIARDIGYTIYAYPGAVTKNLRSAFSSDFYRIPKNTLERNKDIVFDSRIIIATPAQHYEPNSARGSGTWHTIRFARSHYKSLIIVWPNGNTNRENG